MSIIQLTLSSNTADLLFYLEVVSHINIWASSLWKVGLNFLSTPKERVILHQAWTSSSTFTR